MKEKAIRQVRLIVDTVRENICKVFVGKPEKVELLLNGFISGLHVLIEDVPGVGKTTLAKSLAASVNLDFSRIQFTPDLLPGDIIGMNIWNREKQEMTFKAGSIMHQFILADEINRATPRTQSALLEAMQEESVSVDGQTYKLPKPFFVIATQNPSHFLGAYMLPEAELDRFGLSFSLGYPNLAEGIDILDRFRIEDPIHSLSSVAEPEAIIELRSTVRSVDIAPELKKFILDIAAASRSSRLLRLGLSTRATQQYMLAAQARAAIRGRNFIVPEDLLELAVPSLAHRIVLSAEAQMNNISAAGVIEDILSKKKIPVGV
ncbi:MAG: MoxR family ATPase [Spirochaetales bacterium]|nr:MoxR family ATPase [Spirochaetales bacterium]